MTAADLETQVRAGVPVHRRFCRVCRGAITYALSKAGLPVLLGCGCRKRGKSNVVELTWDELRLLASVVER